MCSQTRNGKYLTNEMFVKGTGMYVQKQETWACEVINHFGNRIDMGSKHENRNWLMAKLFYG